MKRMWLPLFLSIVVLSGCQDDNENPIVGDRLDTEKLLQFGLNPDSVTTALKNAEKLPNFYGLLVIKDNTVLVEEYFNGRTESDHYHLRSITKNFTSALTGIAIEQGLIDSLDQPITSHFTGLDPSKEAISIRHLLNMASGLQWNEDSEIIPLIQHAITMPVSNYLSRELTTTPGTQFNYSSVAPHVVSSVISAKTNAGFGAFAEEKLLGPLGISDFKWEKDPEGNEWGGFGLQLLPADLAKFGQLYLNNGFWEGQQLLPEEWVQQSRTSQITFQGGTTGYSLQWWISDDLETKVFYGQGYGGQGLLLIPDKNMMVIGLQEYLVSFEQSRIQWRGFLKDVFDPLYGAID